MFASKDVFFTNRSGGYTIARSVRLRSSASAYLNRTPASAGNQKTWTWSGWVKRGVLGGTQNTLFASTVGATDTTYFQMAFSTVNADCLLINAYNITSLGMQTAAVFRDPAAWYHIVFALDTTQATASNRMKLYVNGVQQTSFLTYINYPALNSTFAINSAAAHNIGASNATSTFDGYLTEINFIDGQALTPSSFGSTNTTTGVWQPIKYTGTYGTNGFYLNFGNNASTTTLGYDTSGNSNNWTTNNISLTAGSTYDSMTDVPTLTSATAANYCVLNPLDWQNTSFPITNGNLTWTSTTTAGGSSRATVGMTSGQWYWEITATSVGAGACGVGVAKDNSTYYGSGQALYSADTGNKYLDGTSTAYGATWATGAVIGVAYDAGAGQITFYKNNASQGTITLSGYAGVNVCPVVADGSSLAFTLDANFGQRPFTYTPPTGFVALNTYNLPTPTITNGATVMGATLYTGNGTTQTVSNAVNGISFQPDLVWYKDRSAVRDHSLFDSIRGTSQGLSSNLTNAESTYSGVTAFNSGGFSLGSSINGNASTETYVGWQWKAGGTSSSNTNGSITSTVSVNATAGFSVCTFNAGSAGNQSFGHGLGVAPSFVIIKDRQATTNWVVYHSSATTTTSQYLVLNTTAGIATASGIWGAALPTSSIVGFGSGVSVIANDNCVAYCWSQVAGYSKFGSYTGNGSTDGPFVFTGFRPRYLLVKLSSAATTSWAIYDSARDTYNTEQNSLFADSSVAEISNSSNGVDFLSNGFKLRTTNATWNSNGATYIYAAFAENSFRNALAR